MTLEKIKRGGATGRRAWFRCLGEIKSCFGFRPALIGFIAGLKSLSTPL